MSVAVSPADDPVAAVLRMREQPDEWLDLQQRTFVLEGCRLLYVQTPKAGCTSVKNMLASLLGDDLERATSDVLPGLSGPALVHDRRLISAPSLADLDPTGLARALTDPAWLRFGVVRNPYARLYSAWEDKVLIGDPSLAALVGAASRHGVIDAEGRLDVRRSFAAFVTQLADQPDRWFRDDHFRPQHQLLWVDVLPYDRIVPVEELDRFVEDLGAHVRRHGTPAPGALLRANVGLGLDWRAAYDLPTTRRVRDLYAGDFTCFGFPTELALRKEPLLLPSSTTRLLAVVADRDRRLLRLQDQLSDSSEELVRLRAELAELRSRWARLEARRPVRWYRALRRLGEGARAQRSRRSRR